MRKPTVLFVHGSWHTPVHFEPICQLFKTAGYATSCPRHPSIGSLPPVGLLDDVQLIRNDLERLVEHECNDVIVIGHSYGGAIITEAVEQRFAKKDREEKSLKGGVLHLVYICAFVPDVGLSSADALGGSLPPFVSVDEDGMTTVSKPESRFYNDLSESEQWRWVKELRPVPTYTTHFAKISYTAYLHNPVTYLLCENDQTLPIEVQKTIVENIKSKGIKINQHTLQAGHSPYLSMPERVLEIVRTIG